MILYGKSLFFFLKDKNSFLNSLKEKNVFVESLGSADYIFRIDSSSFELDSKIYYKTGMNFVDINLNKKEKNIFIRYNLCYTKSKEDFFRNFYDFSMNTESSDGSIEITNNIRVRYQSSHATKIFVRLALSFDSPAWTDWYSVIGSVPSYSRHFGSDESRIYKLGIDYMFKNGYSNHICNSLINTESRIDGYSSRDVDTLIRVHFNNIDIEKFVSKHKNKSISLSRMLLAKEFFFTCKKNVSELALTHRPILFGVINELFSPYSHLFK